MRQLGEKLDLDKDLLKPAMVIANGHTLAGEISQLTAVNLMSHQEDDTLPTPTEFSLLDKECLEIMRLESLPFDTASLLRGGRARDEFGVLDIFRKSPVVVIEVVDEPANGARWRRIGFK